MLTSVSRLQLKSNFQILVTQSKCLKNILCIKNETRECSALKSSKPPKALSTEVVFKGLRIDKALAEFQKNGTLGTLQRYHRTCRIWNSRKTTQYTNVTLGTLVRNHQNILMRHNEMSTTRKEKVCIRPKLEYSEEDKDNYHRDSINITASDRE